MSVRRVMGIETEYAVTEAGSAHPSGPIDNPINPIELSFAVIQGAAEGVPAPVRWDYRPEDPVNDARGYRLPRASARPEMLTDAPQLRPTNVVASNGGRIYVDHAHPEYSSPETMSPLEALAYARVGDVLMHEAAQKASETRGRRIHLFRNNTDGKGASWGAHESYQVARSVPFDTLAQLMVLHFVSRQIYTGAGRVGIGENAEISGFQLSQRADFFHAAIGLQTTFDRPIINTRDESHSTEKYRRLHVIVGDANCADVPEVLKLGTTSMLAWLAENAEAAGFNLKKFLKERELSAPVEALHTVSHDVSLGQPLPRRSGTAITAWQLQVDLRKAVYEAAASIYGTSSLGEPLWPDEETQNIMHLWATVLENVAQLRHENVTERLANTAAAANIEWLLKWQVLENLRRRKNVDWAAPTLAAVDIAWADIDPQRSLFAKLRGTTRQLVTGEQIEAARKPPSDTRAWVRARIIERFGNAVAAASWKQIALRLPEGGIATVDLSDSEVASSEMCKRAVEESGTIAKLVSRLQASNTMSVE